MAAQDENSTPTIDVPPSFQISPQDGRLAGRVGKDPKVAQPPLGVLENFRGNFDGTGLNMIFRPNNGQTPFPGPLDPSLTLNNVLELNLMKESLSFAHPLGDTPNRGLDKQPDISLNGVPYLQSISDVTNLATGKGDASPPRGIHFEPGLWMHVPQTTVVLAESLTRMASIPHGTTINAQCLQPTTSFPGPPPFTGPGALPAVDITPFKINDPNSRIRFASQTASAGNTLRLPQDLTPFIKAGTITQAILDNPNLVLANAIAGQTITNTIVFTVTTTPTAPFLAGGTANIDFLQGSPLGIGIQSGPNASAASMAATFWIETVQHNLAVPVWKHGDKPLFIRVPPANPGAQKGPTFKVKPPHDIKAPKTIKVTYTQIQYMQTVDLNFAGLTWPHVSCATLVPCRPLDVPDEAFN
ncbi:MAG: hypothetical protein Q9160_005795 [Pyrenula sp. 1 TL-2023]